MTRVGTMVAHMYPCTVPWTVPVTETWQANPSCGGHPVNLMPNHGADTRARSSSDRPPAATS